MSRFSKLVKGSKARKPFALSLPNAVEDVQIALVPLSGADEVETFAQARAFAKSKGIDDPKQGDPIYERAIWASTLLIACIDPESLEAAPVPFFDSVEEILGGLDRDRIALLFEAQQAWQDECSPRPGSMSAVEFVDMTFACARAAEGADLPFERLRPVTRRSFVHTLALQYVALQLGRSPTGQDSPENASGSETSPTPSQDAATADTIPPGDA